MIKFDTLTLDQFLELIPLLTGCLYEQEIFEIIKKTNELYEQFPDSAPELKESIKQFAPEHFNKLTIEEIDRKRFILYTKWPELFE